MKRNIFVMMAAAAVFAVSCKKEKTENPEEPQQTVGGYYAGKRNFDPSSNEYTQNYGILFNANGKARVYNLGTGTDTATLLSIAKMDGTWIQSGASITVNYFPIGSPITVAASADKNASNLNGTWGFEGKTKGKFYISKK